MIDHELVTVYESYDTISCRVLTDFLAHSGVTAYFMGSLVGASVGLGEVVVKARIDVHPDDQATAEELIKAFESDYAEIMLERPWELQDDDGQSPAAPDAAPRPEAE